MTVVLSIFAKVIVHYECAFFFFSGFFVVLFSPFRCIRDAGDVSGLLACVCCARRIKYDGMALHCLLHCDVPGSISVS